MSKRGKPKRLFKKPRLPVEITRLVEAITKGQPELREGISEIAAAISSDEFLMVYAIAPMHQRASMLLAMRDTLEIFLRGTKCDCCAARSKHIRFVAVKPGEDFGAMKLLDGQDALIGFMLLCDGCVVRNVAEHKNKLVAKCAEIFPEGTEGYRLPVVPGFRVGEATNIPERRALHPCSDCGEMIWVSQDYADQIEPARVLYLCKQCGLARIENGRIEYIPECLTG